MAQLVKNPPAMQETWDQSQDWEDPLEEGMAPHSSIFPGESHGQRLAGCSPWGHTESGVIKPPSTSTVNTGLRFQVCGLNPDLLCCFSEPVSLFIIKG